MLDRPPFLGPTVAAPNGGTGLGRPVGSFRAAHENGENPGHARPFGARSKRHRPDSQRATSTAQAPRGARYRQQASGLNGMKTELEDLTVSGAGRTRPASRRRNPRAETQGRAEKRRRFDREERRGNRHEGLSRRRSARLQRARSHQGFALFAFGGQHDDEDQARAFGEGQGLAQVSQGHSSAACQRQAARAHADDGQLQSTALAQREGAAQQAPFQERRHQVLTSPACSEGRRNLRGTK